MQTTTKILKNNLKKIMFLDIDGVLTPSAKFIPGKSPVLTKESINVLKMLKEKNFYLVFITARGVGELRLKGGFEDSLKKNNLLENSFIYGSTGMDYVTYGEEFVLKNNDPVYKNGNVVLKRAPVIKRETFSDLDKFLLYKMILGKEIKQQLKNKGIKLLPARPERLSSDARFYFEFQKNTQKNRNYAIKEAKEIVQEQRNAYKLTKVFGSPVDLNVYDIQVGISIEPAMLGKHFGVLRALKCIGVGKNEKIIGYAFGDNDSDSKMSIRKDIKFIKVKGNKEFVKIVKQILNEIK